MVMMTIVMSGDECFDHADGFGDRERLFRFFPIHRSNIRLEGPSAFFKSLFGEFRENDLDVSEYFGLTSLKPDCLVAPLTANIEAMRRQHQNTCLFDEGFHAPMR